MSYAKLRGKIREVFGTQEAFARVIGIDAATLSKKLNASSDWTITEMRGACLALGISAAEAGEYFFEV